MTAEQTERMVPTDTLALRLAIARIYAGHHNAASAAFACGVSRQNWANWERGKPMRHAEALIPYIAQQLGVDEDWLREGGPLGETQAAPRPDGPEGGEVVRHQGLEPRTRWFTASSGGPELAQLGRAA